METQASEGTATAPRELQELKFRPTTKQWRYLEELKAQAEAGQIVPQKETAKRIGCTPTSISIWNRDDRFREAARKILDAHNEPLIPLLQRALLIRGIAGSIKHAELVLRSRGLLDGEPGVGAGGEPRAAAVASVTFIGLPQPLTSAGAAALRPPQGSSVVYRPVMPPALPAPGGKP